MANKRLGNPLALAVALLPFLAIAAPSAFAQEGAAPAPPVLSALDGAQITVRMGGHADDAAFAAEIERDVLPVVSEAAAQFDRLVREGMRARLHKPVRLFVVAGRKDYETVLSREMRVTPAMAQRYSHASGGISVGTGQVAVFFTPEMSRGARLHRAVNATLHELTHELQKQLGFGFYGFEPSRWLTEGSADLFAATLSDRVALKGIRLAGLQGWRAGNLKWWQQDNATALTPDELIDADGKDWFRMTEARRGNYRLAGLMANHLQAMLGEEAFLRAWVRYYLSAGDNEVRSSRAFERAFGLSEKAFLADFKRWLDAQPVAAPPPAPQQQ